MVQALTWTFLAALAAATATRLWLAVRQVRYVAAHRDAVPEAFAAAIPLAEHRKAADYTAAKTRLGMLHVVAAAAGVLVLTLGGLLQWLGGQWARLLEHGGLAHGTALVATVVLLAGALELPFGVYRTFVIEERFGFNRMTPRLFVSDLLKHALLEAAIGLPLAAVVLWLMAAMGPAWWLYAWAFWLVYSLAYTLAYPRWIMPLFNRFSPVADPQLAGRVEALLARCGFRSSGLYVMDGSKRSSHGNAFFIGLGATKRIVLFDTLVDRLAPGEVEAVLAHELGHFRLRHILKSLAIGGALALGLLWGLGQLMQERWFFEGLGLATPSTAGALVLFGVALPPFLFFASPLASRYSRRNEFQADAYAAAHASAADLVAALVKLYKDNAATLTPDPLHSAFYDSHPPAASRIARLRAS